MIKELALCIVFLVAGVAISIVLYPFLRGTVFNLYQLTTDGGIQFVGKNFVLFTPPIYYLSAGSIFLLLYVDLWERSNTDRIQNALLFLLLFAVALVGICALDANQKIIECTACADGVRQLRYNEINTDAILSSSIAFSGLPSMIRLLRKIGSHTATTPAHQGAPQPDHNDPNSPTLPRT